MSPEPSEPSEPPEPSDVSDVYGLLEQVRRRPEDWLPDRSLRHLGSLLTGYRAALGAHAVAEPFAFGPTGPFGDWLRQRLDGPGPLGWVEAIERGTPAGSTPLDEFFQLLDQYRQDGPTVPGAPADPGLRLLGNTFVTLFWRRPLLDETAARLCDHGYRVVTLDASGWSTEQDMHHAFAAAFDFPGYYGRNLDALNDCLRDVVHHGGYQDLPEAAGLALVFTGYDAFAASCPRAAQIVLDIIADQARRAALDGGRVVCLVQSGDPDIRFEPVGATPVLWNDAEWLDARRR